ncbi:Zinc finger MYM-type protein 1 [Glycine soja]
MNISHQEQISFVLRCVNISSTPIQVNEYFLEFLKVDDTSGKGYDNRSNMKGKYQGVQKRFLDINPRSFSTPCGCHSLNLVLCDMANSCPKATSFFGMLQCVYTSFSSSRKRWRILQNHMHSLTLKLLSQTRWEIRIESVKAIKFQTLQIRDVLFELAEASDDPKIKCEADCLANYELKNFEFLLDMTIWYDILFAVNLVSKNLQSKDMCIDEAIEQLKGLLSFFEKYRENGFENALISTKEIAFEMDIEPKFREKCISRKKKQFDENVKDEIVKSLQESFIIDYFLYIVYKAITTLQSRFEQFKIYEDIFGFLFSVKKLKLLDCTLLKEKCLNLEKSLKHDNLLDVDGLDLFSELNILKEIIGLENDKPIYILNYIKRINSFPNAYIVYRIMLTIPISVASAERNFSKLKIIKTYLRSTMSQQRLNKLALLSIEKEMLNEINYDNLIDNFTSQKAQKINFK